MTERPDTKGDVKPRPPFSFLSVAAAAMLLPTTLRAEPSALPTDEQVREILRQRIDVEKRGVSIVVGLVDAQGSRIIAYGHPAKDGDSTVNGKTIYEIGSVTKMFTDLMLADLVLKGEVKLDDPVSKYLPAEVKMPARGDRQITLLDLVTHRSGLPRWPDNLKPADPANDMADYTAAQLYAFLSGYELKRDIGSKMEYSNLGVGLLGHVLTLHAGKSYEQLVKERICDPLGMKDTGITLSPDLRERLALPYDVFRTLTKNTDIAILTGAGGLRSDMEDMLKFVSAELGLTASPLSAAIHETQQKRNATNSPRMDMALGWFIDKTNEPPIWWHNGGTAGYHTYVGFRPATKTGVVVLANTVLDVDDIGQHLLDARIPLTTLPKPHTAITIKPEVGAQYVGRYELTPAFILTITQDGDRYFAQATGQGKNEIYPETETDFFLKVVDAQLTFVKDASGKVTSLILHQRGDQTAKRLP